MTIKELLITPEMAAKMLEGNVHNRTLRQNVAERYARDMKAGKWLFTHEAIAFDFNKTLVDGQHRLWAVILSDTPTRFTVAYDVRPESRGVINCGLMRDTVDQLTLGHDLKVTRNQVAIAKRLLKATIHGKATAAEVSGTLAEHSKAIEFAEKCFTRVVRGITTVPVLTVLTRAHRFGDHDRLRHFAEVLQDGRVSDVSDDAALMLRNYLLERAPRAGGEEQVYAKVERALYAYLHGERLAMLYSAPNEMFPLPSEQTTRIRAGAKLKTVTVGRKLTKRKRAA